jgi:hypothetical protein
MPPIRMHGELPDRGEVTLERAGPTIAVRDNLASALVHAGRLEEAEALYRQTLVMSRKVFGSDHPDTAVALSGLAWVLQRTGRRAEAEPYAREAVE